MNFLIGAKRLARLAEFEPGTIVHPDSASFTNAFRFGVVVSGGDAFDGHGILVLDGEYRLRLILGLNDDFRFVNVPISKLWIAGISGPQENAYSADVGALTVTDGQILLTVTLWIGERPQTSRSYVDLATWTVTSFDAAIKHESWAHYWIQAKSQVDDTEETILVNPAPSKG